MKTLIGTTNDQLWALLRLRWQMIRSGPLKMLVIAAVAGPAVLILFGLLALRSAPEEQAFNIAVATPTFYVGFVILAVIAPLVSGGGYELFPPGQLVAYPIKPATVFRSTLVLAPVNLAWLLNVIALFVVTGFASGPITWAATSRSLVVVGCFIAMATVIGHAVGWLVVGFRQSRPGRVATNIVGLGLVAAALMVLWTDNVVGALDKSPTRFVISGAIDGYALRYSSWLTAIGVMTVATYGALRVGGWITSWTLRRSGAQADRSSSRTMTRRETQTAAWRALVAVDHASLWRSTPLRRGTLVLLVVPGAVSALAGMSWQSLILVPGLIAAGAGLLFGINAFTLDSTGSVWLSTLPGWATPAYIAKSLVFLEVALMAVASALIGGSLRAQAAQAAAEVTAAISSAVACALVVVALGMRSSLRHPHRADLQSSRDTPAPPGVMAAQSIRFATVTTFTSLYFGLLAITGEWWLPLLGAIPVALGAWIHWRKTMEAWLHPHVRAHVVTTVAGG